MAVCFVCVCGVLRRGEGNAMVQEDAKAEDIHNAVESKSLLLWPRHVGTQSGSTLRRVSRVATRRLR
jgi:hypothetical protein